MTPAEKRKFLRLDSLHLLDYLIVDESGNKGEYSMGRTLDVSINGIKMETVNAIPENSNLMITLGIEDDLVDVSGKLIHSHKAASRYVSGIEFGEVKADDRAVLRRYVDEFQARREALLGKNDYPPVQTGAA